MTFHDISNKSSPMALPLGICENEYNSHNSRKLTNEYMISFLLHGCCLYIPCIFQSVPFSSGWLASSWLLFSTSVTIGGLATAKRNIAVVASFWDMIVQTRNMAQTTYSLKNTDQQWLKLCGQWKRISAALCMRLRTLVGRKIHH